MCEIRGGALTDEERRLARLARSLAALRIAAPVGEAPLRVILREVAARNRVRTGIVYLQVSRGGARRDHGFPAAAEPGRIVTAKSIDPKPGEANAARGVKVITLPDERWARPDINSLQLLPNVMAKQAAREAGAYEAWFLDPDGLVTEGASTNAWIVARYGALVTRHAAGVFGGRDRRPADRGGAGKPGPVTLALRRRFHTGAKLSIAIFRMEIFIREFLRRIAQRFGYDAPSGVSSCRG